jgi:hypothetical protein
MPGCRYKASGKIQKDAAGKTSLSEGGSCHMGRAAKLPARKQGSPVLNTRLCRKIHSNHTHVVARCFRSVICNGALCFETFNESHDD